MKDKIIKQIATDFFRHWWNVSGNNTDQGFDDWWKDNSHKYQSLQGEQEREENPKTVILLTAEIYKDENIPIQYCGNVIEEKGLIAQSDTEEECKKSLLKLYWVKKSVEYEQSLEPKAGVKEQSAELLDIQQYVTNLLYAAYNFVHGNAIVFDKWVDEQTELLEQYHNSKSKPK